MIGAECEQLAKENTWSLARKNACHLAVQNNEQGELRDAQYVANTKIEGLEESVEVLGGKMDRIGFQSDMMFGIWGLIGATIVVWLLRNVLKNLFISKEK